MSITVEDRQVRRRLAILRHAEEVTGNVAMTCRYYGITRQSFYLWKRRYEELGPDGLKDRSRRPKTSPNATHADVVGKILYLRQSYHFGPGKIAMYLARYHDVSISSSGVWRILKRPEPVARLPALQAAGPPLAALRKAAPRPPGPDRREVHRPHRRRLPPQALPVHRHRRLHAAAGAAHLLAAEPAHRHPVRRRTTHYFAWTIDSPMAAVFLGASYWSAVGLEVGAARAAPWSGARIAIPAVFVFTTVTLAVTLGHLDTFHVDADLPLTTRAVTWAWLAVYLVVPVLMVAATVAQRGESTAVPAPSGLPLAVRAVLVALAGLLLGLGLALLVAPGWADGAWPWPLTPLTGRAVGAWLVSLGTAAAHARLLDDRASLRPLGITGVIFGVLQAIALVRHGDELDWGSAPATAYLAVLAALAVISAWSPLPSPPQPR